MIYLYIYIAVTTFFTVTSIVYCYYTSAGKGQGRYLTLEDVVMSVFLTQTPVINIFGICTFLNHLWDAWDLSGLANIKVYKERI